MPQDLDTEESIVEPSEEEHPITLRNKKSYIATLQMQIDLEAMIPFYRNNQNVIVQEEDLPGEPETLKKRYRDERAKIEDLEPKVLRGELQRRQEVLNVLFIILASLEDQDKIDQEIQKALSEIENTETKAHLANEIKRIMRLSRTKQLDELPELASNFSKAKMTQFRTDAKRNISKLFNPFRVNKLMKPFVIGRSFLTNPHERERLNKLLALEDYEALLSFIDSGMKYFEDIKGVEKATEEDIHISNNLARIIISLLTRTEEALADIEIDLKQEIGKLRASQYRESESQDK